MHAAYAIGASHQVAGAPDVGKPTPHPDRGHRRRCDHFRCYRCLQRRQSGVQLVQPQLESALVIAEWPASKPVPLRYAPGSAICLVAAARAPHGRHSRPRLPRPIGVYRGHEGDDNGQSIRAIGSALHLAYQQAAGAPDVALSSPTSASRRVARIKTRAAAMRPAAPFAL